MSGQDNLPVEAVEVPTFIRKKHELDKLAKLLEKASPDAVKLITDIMNDATKDIKLRADCAFKLLGLQQSTVQIINADEMARLVAEAKLGNGAVRRLTTVPGEEGKSTTPSLNFEDIREVS